MECEPISVLPDNDSIEIDSLETAFVVNCRFLFTIDDEKFSNEITKLSDNFGVCAVHVCTMYVVKYQFQVLENKFAACTIDVIF